MPAILKMRFLGDGQAHLHISVWIVLDVAWFLISINMSKIFFQKKTCSHIYFLHQENLSIQRVALRKLIMIDNAGCLEDLKVPPANRLELLSGNREGQYSIRINDQYRICFQVEENNFYNVEIVDYH